MKDQYRHYNRCGKSLTFYNKTNNKYIKFNSLTYYNMSKNKVYKTINERRKIKDLCINDELNNFNINLDIINGK